MSDNDLKHYRSTIDPTKTITERPAKSLRFDMSDSWEQFDPETGEAIDPQDGLDDGDADGAAED